MKALLILALALIGATPATQSLAATGATPGPWRLSAVGGKVGCTLALTDLVGPGGRGLQAAPACQRAFPPLKELSVWSVDDKGDLLFSDPDRRHVVAFSGRAGGPYAATAPDGRAWRLDLAAPRPLIDPRT